MQKDEFEKLVSRLESGARNNPEGYRLKVLGLALLGNAYIAAIVLLLGAALVLSAMAVKSAHAVALKLAFAVGALMWVVLKAMWVRIDPPQGVEIRRDDAPALFDMIDELRQRLGSPPFHHVLVDGELNAGVVQSPRLGLLGWPRNYLIVGLPLMKMLSAEQFKAVLAHEFGHLARGHGRVSNWLYRQRLRWNQLWDVLEQSEQWGNFLFKPFLKWFVPYFHAYSFPLARANEYQADATAAHLTSSRAAAEALCGIDVTGDFLARHYWPGIYRRAADQAQPAFTPYRDIGQGVASGLDPDAAASCLERALQRNTDHADTHPALRDRLAALGVAASLQFPSAAEAADHLLGPSRQRLTERFDTTWQQEIATSWRQRFDEVQEGRAQLARLDGQVAEGIELSADDAFARAQLTESVADAPDDALVQYRALHERFGDNAYFAFVLGERLLERNDAAGVALIEDCMRRAERTRARGCELLRAFHERQGNAADAARWETQWNAELENDHAAQVERNRILVKDTFVFHGLDDPDLQTLKAALSAVSGIRAAFLVRKTTRHRSDEPLYLLGYSVTAWHQRHNRRKAERVHRQIMETVSFPGETLIFCVDGDNSAFKKKLRKVDGARIR